MTWAYQSLKNTCESGTCMHSKRVVSSGHACLQYLRVCSASGILGPGQAGTLISGLKTTKVCSARCDVSTGVSPSPSLPSSGRQCPFEIVLSVATSAWLHDVPELALLTLLSFHCLLRLAETRQLRWRDVETFDGSLSTRYKRVSGIV